MSRGHKRALMLLAVLAALELAAAAVLFLAPSPKTKTGADSIDTQIKAHVRMELTSSAFENEADIPPKYTCDGEGVSPPLAIRGVPEDAQSLVLIVDDPDVPKEVKSDGVFDHWVLYNIPSSTSEIREGTSAGMAGQNGIGKAGYVPPCPPKEYQPSRHRYVFALYALDTQLQAHEATKDDLKRLMEGHIIAHTQLVGTYEKK